MPPRLAIGIGCRRGCPADVIVALIDEASHGLDRAGAGLFSIVLKQHETGMHEAAARIGLPLTFLEADALRERASETKTRSDRVAAAVGLSSVAEAAALAGAGPGARLLVPRMARSGATCAVACR